MLTPAARLAPAIVVISTVVAAAARGQDSARWEVSSELRGGAPSGWVQVRENSLGGTRLSLASGLAVHALWAADLRAEYRADERTRFSLTITGLSARGNVTLAQDVDFNGATLAAGTTLATATDPSHWLAVTLAASRRVARPGGGELDVTAGLSFVALTWVLHGTLTPTSATRETQEDFVTQELPVPMLGAGYRLPLGTRWRFDARALGGWLPWVSSLRQEGGTVYLNESMLQLTAGARYAATRSVAFTGDLRYDALYQNEQSNEDGNEIVTRAMMFGLGVAVSF